MDGTPYRVIGIGEKQGSTFVEARTIGLVSLTSYQRNYGTGRR